MFSRKWAETILTFKVTVTLTFDIVPQKSSISHVNICKYFVINSFQDNQRKPYSLPTDVQIHRPTLAKQYTPSSSKGDIKMIIITMQILRLIFIYVFKYTFHKTSMQEACVLHLHYQVINSELFLKCTNKKLQSQITNA